MNELETSRAHPDDAAHPSWAALDALDDAVLVYDAALRVRALNPHAAALLAWPRAQALGQSLAELAPQHLRRRGVEEAERYARERFGAPSAASRATVQRRDGLELDVELRVAPLPGAPPAHWLATLRTAKPAEPSAAGRDERYRQVFERAPIGILHFDARGVITAVNEPVQRTLGAPRATLVGLHMTTLPDPRMVRAVREALAGTPGLFEGEYVSATGRKRSEVRVSFRPIIDDDGAVLGGVGLVDDVTERRAIEAQLVQSERLASLGTLAAGIAHEVNNPLAYVLANLELAQRAAAGLAPDDEALRSALDSAREGAERVRRIVRDLKLFAQAEPEQRALVDPEAALDAATKLAWNELRHRAQLVRRYAGVPSVWGDEARLTQVCLQLLLRAAQAIPLGDAEHHEVRLRTGHDDALVWLEVEDTGEAPSSEALGRFFEPYFDAQQRGGPGGLGLSVSHGIVRSLGGTLTARAVEPRGSALRVTLPRAAQAPAASPPRDEAAEPSAASPTPRRSRLLVIDDELLLARTLRLGLAPRHDVELESSGRAALERLRADPRFDAVLCDLMMPDVTGIELYEALAREGSGVHERFVFMTGGVFTQQAQDFLRAVPNRCLDKPFSLDELERALRTLPAAR